MYIAKIAILIAMGLLPVARARCFGEGETWGSSANRARATSFLNEVCSELQGSYGAGITKSACRNGNDNIRFNYAVKHISGGGRDLGVNECIDGLNKEITGCDRGGRTSYTNWEYT